MLLRSRSHQKRLHEPHLALAQHIEPLQQTIHSQAEGRYSEPSPGAPQRAQTTTLQEQPIIIIIIIDRFYIALAILHSRADSLCSHVILHEWIAFYSTFLEYPPKWCTYSAIIIIIIISGHDQSAPCLQHEQQAKWLWEVLLFSMTLFHHRLKVGTGNPVLVLLHVHKPPANKNSPSSSSSSVHIISLHCAYNMNSRQSGWAGRMGGWGGG